jgi:predicted PurR-regulated permease PerM
VTIALAQISPTLIAGIVSVLTILGVMVTVLRFMYTLGGKIQNLVDKFDAATKEIQTNKAAADKIAADLAEHCEDEDQHVNLKLEQFREQVLSERLDDMGQKLNLLLLRRNPDA